MKAVCYGRPFSFRKGGSFYGNHKNHAASCRQGPHRKSGDQCMYRFPTQNLETLPGLWEPITLLRRNFDFPNMKRASKAEILYLWQSCLIIHLRQSSRVQKTRNVCRSISPLCRTVLIVLFCGIVIIALLWRFHIILI